MFSKKVFSKRVKMLRISHNLSQADLAKIVGFSYSSAIGDIERGRRTTPIDKIVALADYFEVSVDYLVGRTDNPEINK
ncbi:MAG: helix-turn-helix domain-containing protein [Clostridiaceae bacterium]|nr:helix-turn-helix domain-containing protein [Clostridiaceae bacterium]MBW4858529.1 helix-turn-helix domain-containing protein [Clostridiaceae bacterium]MBW4867777.1 helix-turn-helix domain-containing protein [Clostridiaceae bacterium]MBW4868033.1 helix-turn-helix domain-containing protein [Clostridiaceae bacterium]